MAERRPSKTPVPKWLVKSEPSAFSWHDLLQSDHQTTRWDGVRNYQARNLLRDGFCLGDRVFFYQSCAKPLAIVGIMQVVRSAYPDPTQFDPTSDFFDGKSPQHTPRWQAVDLRALASLKAPITLAALRGAPACADLPLLRKGNRLSVQPVPISAARFILAEAAL